MAPPITLQPGLFEGEDILEALLDLRRRGAGGGGGIDGAGHIGLIQILLQEGIRGEGLHICHPPAECGELHGQVAHMVAANTQPVYDARNLDTSLGG